VLLCRKEKTLRCGDGSVAAKSIDQLRVLDLKTKQGNGVTFKGDGIQLETCQSTRMEKVDAQYQRFLAGGRSGDG
jgi:hypothetical protein